MHSLVNEKQNIFLSNGENLGCQKLMDNFGNSILLRTQKYMSVFRVMCIRFILK